MMVHVIARMEIKEGQMERMLEVLSEIVPLVRAESGCIRYEVCLDAGVGIGAPANPRALTIVEAWESPKHLSDHLATPHMAIFRDKAGNLRENATVTVLSPKI
ncbi:MAG: putative quinol monooxygenase [Lentisphaeria bacterium]|nr:putative quinol monooxygenase [Lentisphaeria bacterium]